jgi:ketosteroid isomerase-like protein
MQSDNVTSPGSQVDRLFDMYNTLDFSALESTLTSDFQRTAPGMSVSSTTGMMDLLKGLRQAYPDLRLEGHERSFAENLAFVHWTVTATAGDGKAHSIMGITMFEFRDGKIARDTTYFDPATIPAP